MVGAGAGERRGSSTIASYRRHIQKKWAQARGAPETTMRKKSIDSRGKSEEAINLLHCLRRRRTWTVSSNPQKESPQKRREKYSGGKLSPKGPDTISLRGRLRRSGKNYRYGGNLLRRTRRRWAPLRVIWRGRLAP